METYLDTHPDRSPDLCHVFGDAQTRGEIDRMYLLPLDCREDEYQNAFDRNLWEEWEVITRWGAGWCAPVEGKEANDYVERTDFER